LSEQKTGKSKERLQVLYWLSTGQSQNVEELATRTGHHRTTVSRWLSIYSIINLSPYSPDFNPIELWGSQLKYFLGKFYPLTTKVIDTLIAGSLDLINPQYLKNWFTKCC